MPRSCPDCLLPLSECICDDEPVMFPGNAGPLLHKMLGGGEPEPGPPYTHVLRLPETEEEMAAEPDAPHFTMERGNSGGAA